MKSLKYYRKSLGMTQAELASALGRSREDVQKWESDKPPPPRHAVMATRSLAFEAQLAAMAVAIEAALITIQERGEG